MPQECILLDTNILIRWAHRDAQDYLIVRSAIKTLITSQVMPCYASQNLAEFWNVLTRPVNRNGFGYSPSVADIKAGEIETAFQLLPESDDVHRIWCRLLLDYQVSGVQVHDTRLVASMLVHGVNRILTFNTQDFSRFDKIEAIHPLNLK